MIEIIREDLRALLFWAAIGVSKSRGGSYQKEIEYILETYAQGISYKIPHSFHFKK